jgi:hypothetical protein
MRCKLITGVTGDQLVAMALLRRVRVAGTANLVGAVQIKAGSTVLETLPAASTPGTERWWEDTQFDTNTGVLAINMANAGDSVLVWFT